MVPSGEGGNPWRPAGESGGENIRYGPSTLDVWRCTSLRSVAQQEPVIVDLTTLSFSLPLFFASIFIRDRSRVTDDAPVDPSGRQHMAKAT